MDYDEACHTNGEMWSVIYRTLKEIREVRELLCTDELEKVSQKMELIEKEIYILSVFNLLLVTICHDVLRFVSGMSYVKL